MNTRISPEKLRATPVAPLKLRPERRAGKPIGQILVELGELSAGDMIKAVAMSARENARFGDILLANDMVSEHGLTRALSQQFGCEIANFDTDPPDTRLIDLFGAQRCLQLGAIPWKKSARQPFLLPHAQTNFLPKSRNCSRILDTSCWQLHPNR